MLLPEALLWKGLYRTNVSRFLLGSHRLDSLECGTSSLFEPLDSLVRSARWTSWPEALTAIGLKLLEPKETVSFFFRGSFLRAFSELPMQRSEEVVDE